MKHRNRRILNSVFHIKMFLILCFIRNVSEESSQFNFWGHSFENNFFHIYFLKKAPAAYAPPPPPAYHAAAPAYPGIYRTFTLFFFKSKYIFSNWIRNETCFVWNGLHSKIALMQPWKTISFNEIHINFYSFSAPAPAYAAPAPAYAAPASYAPGKFTFFFLCFNIQFLNVQK